MAKEDGRYTATFELPVNCKKVLHPYNTIEFFILFSKQNDRCTIKPNRMNTTLTHFAIYTDDMERAKKFYDNIFEWGFNSYGPQDFLQIKTGKSDDSELIGALQSRSYSPVQEKVIGLECSFNVQNIDDLIERVKQNGGTIVMPKTAIPYVGWIVKFLDTEGNLICGIQYDNQPNER